MTEINIQKYRESGSKIFSGRSMGISARQENELTKKDSDLEEYNIIVPEDTYSISGSFFGGMFSDSVLNLGEEKFKEKYHFKFKKSEINEVLQEDIEEGIYDVLNMR